VGLVRTDVSNDYGASIIRATRVGELWILQVIQKYYSTANVVPDSTILVTIMIGAIRSSETSGLRRSTRRNIPEDGIFNKTNL
jgi:hypothetical protein